MGRETDEKVNRVARLAREAGAGGVLLATQRNVAWLTGGGTNRIDGSRETGAGSLVITADARRFAVANAIEMPRLMSEVVSGLEFEAVEYPWVDDQANPAVAVEHVRSLVGDQAPVAADWFFPGTQMIEGAMMRARVPLVNEEVDRYRALGRDVGRAVGDACRKLQPGMTEEQVAGVVAGAVCVFGARPIVVLVAGDERLSRYRHPVATSNVWRNVVMVVVCAERHGLVVALSRIVCAGPAPGDLRTRTAATAQVFARLLQATSAGATGADLYAVAARAYEQVGFSGEERHHHQGGATGYRSREWVAHPQSREIVAACQAFAWNPSITGTKIEDTVLYTNGSYEVLTLSPDWPTIPFEINGQTLLVADVLRSGS